MGKLDVDTNYILEILKKLLEIPSPTGYTDAIARFVSEELHSLGLEPKLTRRGAVMAIRKGEEHRGARAIVSHLDTLGAQVKRLKENGRLEVVPIGHWSARFAEGARITLFSGKGSYRGTILPLKASGHTFNDEVDELPVGWPYTEARIDAPSRSVDDLHKLGIEVGDIIAVDPQPEFLDNGFIVSRHLDNKAGVALMLGALKAMQEANAETPVDIHWMFTIEEEVGVGASTVIEKEVAALLAIDNGTTAPGQNSDEFGVTICMADQGGPLDFHLTKKLVDICKSESIPYQKDVFRYYRSDLSSALEAGHDIRTALATFGIDASHGYERIHVHALVSIAELITAYTTSPFGIKRDMYEKAGLKGFTSQPMEKAPQDLSKDVKEKYLKHDQ